MPDCKFDYDRMMTKGDASCHWAIRKKKAVAEETNASGAPVDDPAKRMAHRLIDGEISGDEFDKTMALLRRHGFVK